MKCRDCKGEAIGHLAVCHECYGRIVQEGRAMTEGICDKSGYSDEKKRQRLLQYDIDMVREKLR